MADLDSNGDGAVSTGEIDEADKVAEAEAMTALEHELGELGIEFHGSASDSMLNFLQHLVSCIKTHKSTKAGGAGKPDQQQDPNQQQADPNNPNSDPEVAEPQPIMMSTALEAVLAKKILKDSLAGLTPRIESLHKAGWIDDANKKDLLTRLGTVSLSLADLDAKTGTVKASTVEIEIATIERLAKSGKPGPFAKKAAAPAFNPNKPIETASHNNVSLSADEKPVEKLYDGVDDEEQFKARLKEQEAAGDDLASRTMTASGK
jgi:hypothetical protein